MESKRASTGLGFVLAVYVASRLFYLVAGFYFVRFLPISPFNEFTLDSPFGTMNIWAHWDGEHYMRLARSGYLNEPDNVSPAFFPLYPLLIRPFASLFGGPVTLPVLGLWGVIISLAALPFALYFIYRIAEHGWGERVAKAAVLTMAFFPTTFFLNSAYTESLFLALSAGTVWAAMVRKDLLVACILAGLATATRNVGIFLLVPLAYEWMKNAEYYRWRGAYLLVAPSGLMAYMGYLWWRFGEPLLFYTEQGDWNREAMGPLRTFTLSFERARESLVGMFEALVREGFSVERVMNGLGQANSAYGLLLLLLATLLILAGLRILPLSLSVYAFLASVVPAFFGTPENPLMGLPRYLLVAFPLFIVLGVLLESRWVLVAWLTASAAASLVLCALFVTWRYVA